MRPRELVEKDERVRERKINRDGRATLVSSCAGTGNNRGWLEFNGRAAQYALSETTSSLLFSFFLVRFFSLLLRGIVPTLVSSPLEPHNSRAYLVYSFNTSLSNRLLQLQYRATVLSRSPRTPRSSVGLDGNRSSITRFGMIFEKEIISESFGWKFVFYDISRVTKITYRFISSLKSFQNRRIWWLHTCSKKIIVFKIITHEK